MIQRQVPILFNHHLAGATYVVGFDCAEIARAAAPGTFVMMREVQPRGYLLNRPFSIGNIDGDTVEIYYDAVGRATRAFAELHKGDALDVFGPLGTSFTLDTGAAVNVLVAGGIGIAPFPFLAIELAKRKHAGRTMLLAGFRTSSIVVLEEFFDQIDVEYKVATDDGSRGYKGFVTGLLERELDEHAGEKVAIYGCGPEPMLRRVAEITNERDMLCELSLERRMACGVGACLVCACSVRAEDGASEYQMVCKDGPVFNARDVVFG